MFKKKKKKEILQKELIETKQRMGDVLNELSEIEKKNVLVLKELEESKKKKSKKEK